MCWLLCGRLVMQNRAQFTAVCHDWLRLACRDIMLANLIFSGCTVDPCITTFLQMLAGTTTEIVSIVGAMTGTMALPTEAPALKAGTGTPDLEAISEMAAQTTQISKTGASLILAEIRLLFHSSKATHLLVTVPCVPASALIMSAWLSVHCVPSNA